VVSNGATTKKNLKKKNALMSLGKFFPNRPSQGFWAICSGSGNLNILLLPIGTPRAVPYIVSAPRALKMTTRQ
jgi:hypothetical protein